MDFAIKFSFFHVAVEQSPRVSRIKSEFALLLFFLISALVKSRARWSLNVNNLLISPHQQPNDEKYNPKEEANKS